MAVLCYAACRSQRLPSLQRSLGVRVKLPRQCQFLFVGLSVKSVLGLTVLALIAGAWPRYFEQQFLVKFIMIEHVLRLAHSFESHGARQSETEKPTPRRSQKAREQGQVSAQPRLAAALTATGCAPDDLSPDTFVCSRVATFVQANSLTIDFWGFAV